MGWSYVAEKLRKDGVAESDILAALNSPDVPPFDFVPFALRPKESKSLYKGATKPEMVAIALDGINSNYAIFAEMERRYGVDRAIVAAILTIESKFGRYTGKHSVFYRLLRLVTTNDPNNVRWNYARLKDEDSSTQMQEVVERGQYLEKTFYPELLAVFEICRREDMQIHDLRGSIAGAFGLSQFMPRSYLAFSVDGNRNGKISLYEPGDAIMSVGNFLYQHGWKHQVAREQKRRAVWGYNKSEAYIDAVFGLASLVERTLARANTKKRVLVPAQPRPELREPPKNRLQPQRTPNRPESPPVAGGGDGGSDESGFIELDDLY